MTFMSTEKFIYFQCRHQAPKLPGCLKKQPGIIREGLGFYLLFPSEEKHSQTKQAERSRFRYLVAGHIRNSQLIKPAEVTVGATLVEQPHIIGRQTCAALTRYDSVIEHAVEPEVDIVVGCATCTVNHDRHMRPLHCRNYEAGCYIFP